MHIHTELRNHWFLKILHQIESNSEQICNTFFHLPANTVDAMRFSLVVLLFSHDSLWNCRVEILFFLKIFMDFAKLEKMLSDFHHIFMYSQAFLSQRSNFTKNAENQGEFFENLFF